MVDGVEYILHRIPVSFTLKHLGADILLYKLWRSKGFRNWDHPNVPLHLNTYVMGLRPLEINIIFSRGSTLDVRIGRQILTSDPRALDTEGLKGGWYRARTAWIQTGSGGG